nr:uncharacterized protein LOC127336569 [Lolium perenne]
MRRSLAPSSANTLPPSNVRNLSTTAHGDTRQGEAPIEEVWGALVAGEDLAVHDILLHVFGGWSLERAGGALEFAEMAQERGHAGRALMLVLTSSVQEGAAAVESIEEDAGLFSLHALRQPQPRRDLLHPGWWMVKMQFPFSSPLHFWILMLLCHES